MCYRSNGFLVGSDIAYQGQVKSVKDNVVTFMLQGNTQQNLLGSYYMPSDCRINPHTIFKVGAFWSVKIDKITKRFRKKEHIAYQELNIDVTPLHMPTDDFIATHPVGSKVTGIVKHIFHSGDCLIHLAPNVECTISHCRKLSKGDSVECIIKSYNAQKKCLSISI